jgi:hypothetical protein
LQWRLCWVGLVTAASGLAALTVASLVGAQETKVRLEVPSGDITVGDAAFPVEVVVEDVVDLGAFEFNLAYDESILRYAGVTRSPFLGSSGRLVECLDPRLSPGSVRFVCVTLGRQPPGPDGSGTLATVSLKPVGPGTSPIRFDVLTLARPNAEQIPATAEGAAIAVAPVGGQATPPPTGSPAGPIDLTVTEAVPATPTSAAGAVPAGGDDGGETNWVLWGSVIGAVAFVVAAGATGVAWWSRARKPT